jgi:hypothetical protein
MFDDLVYIASIKVLLIYNSKNNFELIYKKEIYDTI